MKIILTVVVGEISGLEILPLPVIAGKASSQRVKIAWLIVVLPQPIPESVNILT